jgi:uncharacterized protein (TIGR03437 family)
MRLSLLAAVLAATASFAASPNRIVGHIDSSRVKAVTGNLHRLAQAQYDQGPVDPTMRMEYMQMIFQPSAAQQADLDQLLIDQQNPSSAFYRKWLTPEQFGDRFGLSVSDQSKVVAWLASEGFTIDETARGRNWVAFSGTAAQVSKSLHTEIHKLNVIGEPHFANMSAPSVPEAMAGVVGGIVGLHDFHPKSGAKLNPRYNSAAGSHALAPEDFATIYDLGPLYDGGIDGTGVNIAVVGQSDIALSDMRAFRTRYGLPAKDPMQVLYGGADPGFNGAQVEANLDLQWSGAVARNATIYYVYGADAFGAANAAVNLNLASIISISYSGCEVDASPTFYRAFAQQGNAQGITLVAASGDAGAAACDFQGDEAQATRGKSVNFPVVMPEVTGVGGTQFVEGTGTYWAPTNDAVFGSALSYIPEQAWNETSVANGIGSSGGGASRIYSKPAWQNGPGVPSDNARDVPDIALSAAIHDGYLINYLGSNGAIGGTSASAPSMAGILALINHYLVKQGNLAHPGLGNINPQLYRMAQSVPAAFHDITTGDNIVPCAQGSPDCLAGSFGYAAGAGYDQATGLGSIDANVLATSWNAQVNGVAVTLTASSTNATLNDSVTLTATVTTSGAGTPTGSVTFGSSGKPLGSATLTAGSASISSVPLYLLGSGKRTVTAYYSGDAAFSSGGGQLTIQVTIPTGLAAAIVLSAPDVVWPFEPDAQGLSWQPSFTLTETAGVPAMVTGFAIDGQSQPLAKYFPSTSIAASRSLTTNVVFRNQTTPATHTVLFAGVDSFGATWTRQATVTLNALPENLNFNLAATPLIIAQNPNADPSCQWSTQVNIDDLSGFPDTMNFLASSSVDLSSTVAATFGTTRLEAWGGVQGTICYSGIAAPSANPTYLLMEMASGDLQEIALYFTGPPANPTKLSATPANVTLSGPVVPLNVAATTLPTATLAVGIADKTQSWTAAIYPNNRTTSWLTLSQYTGTGPAVITLTANGAGFEPGAYRATIVIQSPNALPQYIDVPVLFSLGASPATSIAGVELSAGFQLTGSPGALLSIFGSNLANTKALVSGNPLPYVASGVSATINGLPAPIVYLSPSQINLQIPYGAGAGPASLSVNNNGQVATFGFTMLPASPGIFADAAGNLAPTATVKQGAAIAMYVTGVGDLTTGIPTGYSPSTTVLANLPRPFLPLSVTVGGVPAFLTYFAESPGLLGTLQVNFIVPSTVAVGVQAVVITVNGVKSPPVNIQVTAGQ